MAKMAIEVIDDKAMVDSLTAGYELEYPDMVLINIHHACSPAGKPSDYEGLDIALQKAPEGRPIILYGFETQSWMMNDPRFVSLIEKSNVSYVRVPFRRADIVAAYRSSKR